jgi:O-antigen/teichoic acid export membrane protein
MVRRDSIGDASNASNPSVSEHITKAAVSTESLSTEDTVDLQALQSKAARASVWTILEYGSGMALRVVSSLVLTRLLLPAVFGEMTLLSTLIIGLTLLSDIGLAPSVIQSPQGDEPLFLNTAWSIQFLRGAAIWLCALAASWMAARFYHDPKLAILLPVLALTALISGLNSTNLLSLSRHMGVKRLFAVDGSTALVNLLCTIVWAYFRPSIWAIVGGQLISVVYKLGLSHMPAIAPGIKNHFVWDKQSAHSIIHFGKWIMLGTAFFFFASQADRLILGRLISLSLLGIYGIAYSLSDIPRAVILSLSSRVAYPFISRIIHLPKDEFRRRFLHYRLYALMAGAALLSIMVVWGHLLIIKLYDPRYRQAAWMIPILALGLWQTLLYQTTAPVLFSLGKTKYNALGNAAYCVTMLAGIPISFHFFGLRGAVIAVAAGDFPLYAVTQFGARREGVSPFGQDLKATAIFLGLLCGFFAMRTYL